MLGVGWCWVATIYYSLIYSPTHTFAGWSAMLLDYFVGYSISREAYTRSGFMESGWEVVRDIVNIGFIFVLLYLAFLVMLNVKKHDSKRLLIRLLLIALVVNFSLFISKTIIDASNGLSHIFYNRIPVEQVEYTSNVEGKYKAITLQIIDKINPARIVFASSLFEGQKSSSVSIQKLLDTGGLGMFFLIYILATVLNVAMIFIFFSIALLFVTRVVSLWLYTIFSPLAFISYATPGGEQMKYIGWKAWWSNMLNVAFVAPIFIFLMYLIVNFLNVGFENLNIEKSGWTVTLSGFLEVLAPFVLVLVLLLFAKKITTKMSGEMAVGAVSWANKVIAGATLGAVAVGARSTISRGAARVGESKKLKDDVAGGGWKGWGARRILDAADWTKKRSFDVRSLKPVQFAAKQAGVELGKPIKSEAEFQKERQRKQEAKAIERDKRYGFADRRTSLLKSVQEAEGIVKNKEEAVRSAKEDIKLTTNETELAKKEQELLKKQALLRDARRDLQRTRKQTNEELERVFERQIKYTVPGIKGKDVLGSGFYGLRGIFENLFISRARRDGIISTLRKKQKGPSDVEKIIEGVTKGVKKDT